MVLLFIEWVFGHAIILLLTLYLFFRFGPACAKPYAFFAFWGFFVVFLWAIIDVCFIRNYNDTNLITKDYEKGDQFEKLASFYGMVLPEDWKPRLQNFGAENNVKEVSRGHDVLFIWDKLKYPNGKALYKGHIHLNQASALSYLCSDEQNNVYGISPEDCARICADKVVFEDEVRLIAFHESGHKISSIPYPLILFFPFLSLIDECFADIYAARVSGYSREMIGRIYAVKSFKKHTPSFFYLPFEKRRAFILQGRFTEEDIRAIARNYFVCPFSLWLAIYWYRKHGLFIESAYS